MQFCVCSLISTSRWLRIGISSSRPGRELHRGLCRPIHRPRVWLPSRFRSSNQRRGNQACDRGDHGGTQHRSDAPDDDLSLCIRPAGHGVDHDPQHHRHRDRSTIRPDVEARCFTIGRPCTNQPASKRRPAPANFDVTRDPPVVADLPDEGEFFLVPVGANPTEACSIRASKPPCGGLAGLIELRRRGSAQRHAELLA